MKGMKKKGREGKEGRWEWLWEGGRVKRGMVWLRKGCGLEGNNFGKRR